MLNKRTYLEMKKIIADYESDKLNNQDNTDSVELPYLEIINIDIERKYNPKYGNNRICKCGHTYYKHFDTYEGMEACGCKYCRCKTFEEAQ